MANHIAAPEIPNTNAGGGIIDNHPLDNIELALSTHKSQALKSLDIISHLFAKNTMVSNDVNAHKAITINYYNVNI